MARVARRLNATVFLVLSLIRIGFSADSTTAKLLLSHNRTSMVLPLFLSPLNSSKTFSNSHRHLQRSDPKSLSNARMRLFDDLLRNGYYTTRLNIGTPPQQFALIVDSGSTVTYVPCSTCEQCGKHQDPNFQPDLSSTYKPVKCYIDCECDNEREQCIYERQYAEMSTSSGVLGEDIISFGDQSELVPQRAVFGCENAETGDIYSQHADGIMGLGRGDLSIVDQLVDKGVINNSFSLCYGGMDIGGGAMVLGGISPPSDMIFSYSDPDRSPYYNIDLKEIHVAGNRLPLNPSVFDVRHGTILDSGTTYGYLPDAAFSAFKDAMMRELHDLKMIPGPDPEFNDTCFSAAESEVSRLGNIFPVVDMVFGNGQKMSLSPENYLFRHSKVNGAYCLGIFLNDKDPSTLLGGIIVRNTLVMYDRENSKVGFWKTNCSELWERLETSASPPPVPSVPYSTNSTATAPIQAPSGAPNYIVPGEDPIGQITFDMLFNVSYIDMKPQITELPQLIANELNVNTSQVNPLSFTSMGNDSLIRLAVLPARSAEYIPNTIATKIIVQFVEHHLQLPLTFGSYQLVRWNTEPATRRLRWQKHYQTLVLAVIGVLMIVLSASGMWFIWKRRQQTINSYKPVDVTVPEQELQPL